MKIFFSNFSNKHLIFSENVRKEFFSRNYEGEKLLIAARHIVSIYLISTLRVDDSGQLLYKKLINSGYNSDQIIDSIARAWLDDSDFFELPELNRSIHQNLIFRNFFIPLAGTLLVTFLILLYLISEKSDIIIDIFVAPPLVAIFCSVLFFVFYKIFKKR